MLLPYLTSCIFFVSSLFQGPNITTELSAACAALCPQQGVEGPSNLAVA